MDLAHVTRDHQHLVSLEFHERGRRNKTVHSHRAPADLCQDIVHLLNPRDSLKRDAGVEEPLEVDFVRVLLQEKNVLAHDEPPDCMVYRSVIVVPLIDCELEQMFGATGDCRVVIADTTLRFHSRPPHWANINYDSFATRARMIACTQVVRWIGFFEDYRKQIAESANSGGESVHFANALRTARST